VNTQLAPVKIDSTAKARSANGEADAVFANLFKPAQQRVFRLALRITRSAEDAEDVQQETFLKVHRKMDQFEGRSQFTTWISRIAINEALMCLRKRRSNTHVSLEESLQPGSDRLPIDALPAPIEDPEEAYARKEVNESLAQALSILRPGYRVVFLLRVVEQLSTIETARILKISVSSVKARMRRARQELQEHMLARNAAMVSSRHTRGLAPV
jgi:RNA polymerase sigma-70 factor (ECF subfamily)